MLKVCCQNQLDCNKHFLMTMKSNRNASLTLEDKRQGRSQRIDTVNFTEDKPIKGWIAGGRFPCLVIPASL